MEKLRLTFIGHENDRLRHIKLHEQVNELPDPNYATLKYFMGHLDRYVIVFPFRLSEVDFLDHWPQGPKARRDIIAIADGAAFDGKRASTKCR